MHLASVAFCAVGSKGASSTPVVLLLLRLVTALVAPIGRVGSP